VLLAVAALCGITVATLFEKWHGFRTDPALGGVVQYLVGFAVLMPVAAATESLAVDWHPELILALAYLVVANSIVSIGLYIALLQRGDATRISSLLYLVPPLALLVAWAILGETVPPPALLGLALSVAGVYIVNRQTA
jgi:drug/metabolite transporter (DMT)-like permease